MKKLYILLAAILLTATTFAQTPEKMSYQAVVRDSGDALIANQAVGMQISILQTSAAGASVYVETQTPTTNINGLVSLEIGTGTPVTGTFAGIDWANGPYFIKTETDPTGGSSYTITGTSQLLSVPFALYSANTAGLDLKANINNPTFTGNVGMGSNLNVAGDLSLGGNMSFNGGLFLNSWDIYTNPGVFSINESGVAPHFNIIPGGNVGIGTSSPQAPFDVRTSTSTTGVAVFKNDLPTWAYISIGNQTTGASGSNGLMLGYTPSNEALIRNLYNSPMSFWTNNVERMRISADGNVGIGINNPTAKLDIAGTFKISDGTEGAAKVLTSDADGNASWQATNQLLTTYEAASIAVNPLSADVTGSLIYTQNSESPNFPEDLPDGFTCTIINYSNYLFTSNVLTTAVFVTDASGNAGSSSFSIPSGGTVKVYVMTNPNSAQKLYYIK